MTTPLTFRLDSDLWEFAFNGAERLPSGGEPKFAEIALAGLPEAALVAILTGDGRGGIAVAIEGTTADDETVSGDLWLGTAVTEAGAERIAAALLAGSPSIETLTSFGFRFR